ncbi:MAG: SDR family NAD(P)-dependent oxidoreductase [Bacteroidota bacterium]
MNKIALITGATSGIGRATAIKLAEIGIDVIITGRRTRLIGELEKEITTKTKSRALALSFDIRDNEAVIKSIDRLPSDWQNIDILVNNAGLAVGLDPINSGNIEDWEIMIDTNLKGLLYITRKIVPAMIGRKSGHIINIGSIAGKEVYPNGNVYCATKHAVDSLTKAMRIDLLKYGIKVSQIAPGMTETEFAKVRFNGDAMKAKQVYEGFEPLIAEDVAEAILFAVTRPSHVNINDMVILATNQANSIYTYKKTGE